MFSYQNYTVKDYWREIVLILLILANIFVWFAIFREGPSTLKVYFLDIGQGDAIFIETPSHKQVLIDTGRDRRILSELGGVMDFGDHFIDIVLITHPDIDHIGGLGAVRERYKMGLELDNTKVRRGQVVDFGDGARLTMLFPDRDVSTWDTNDASVVARLDYGESSFLLTGDATFKTENAMIYHGLQMLDVDVLKVGHHGSKTSTSLDFAQATSPEYAVISAGRDNSYGHPHQVVLDILDRVGAKVISTIDMGTIEFEADGESLILR